MKKIIPNTDNIYFATRNGKIFKLEKEIAQCQDRANNGYLQCTIKINGEYKKQKVHRLIAMTFLGDIKNKVVNHIDGNKQNNNVSNLEIITQLENMKHAKTLPSFKIGRAKCEKSRMKLNDSEMQSLLLDAEKLSLNQMAKKYSIGQSTVSGYLKRLGFKRKTKKINQYK